jgi:hypothetical protein
MLKKTRIKLINLFKSMIKDYDDETFNKIVYKCVNEAFNVHSGRKYTGRKHIEIKDWETFKQINITTYTEDGVKTIVHKEVFQFHDLADLIIEKDSFIEKIREKFEIGK